MTEIGMDLGDKRYSGGWQSGMDLSEMHWLSVSNTTSMNFIWFSMILFHLLLSTIITST